MPTHEVSPRPQDADASYYYRRPLRFRELVPAIGVAIGAGLVAFYIARLMLERTPLEVQRRPRTRRSVVERSAEA